MEHYENKQIFINDKYKGCSSSRRRRGRQGVDTDGAGAAAAQKDAPSDNVCVCVCECTSLCAHVCVRLSVFVYEKFSI